MDQDKIMEKSIVTSDAIVSKESLRVQKAAWVGHRIKKQREIEDEKRERLLKEQQIIDERKRSVEEDMDYTSELQRYNEECRADLNRQVYAMHGLTDDKLEGMRQYKNAYYQGLALGLFFLSAVLIVLCGWLHGFDSEICLFMLACTGVEGALLSQESKRGKLFDMFCRFLYILIFPVMLTIFVCYELDFPEYYTLQPIFTIAGIVILVIGTSAYFFYNPYSKEKKNIRSARGDLREIEQIARKEVKKNQKIRKKEEAKLAKKQKKEEEKFARLQKKEEMKFAKLQKREESKLLKLQKKEEMRAVRKEKQEELRSVRLQNRAEQVKIRKQKIEEFRERFFARIKKTEPETEEEQKNTSVQMQEVTSENKSKTDGEEIKEVPTEELQKSGSEEIKEVPSEELHSTSVGIEEALQKDIQEAAS